MKKLALPIALFALVAVFFLLFRISKLEKQIQLSQRAAPITHVEAHDGHEDEEIEVAIYMDRLHRFSVKLFAAGSNGNSALVNFYLHEMEEVMEELIEADLDEDGFDMSKYLQLYGLDALERFKKDYKANGKAGILDTHSSLVLSCNSCHAASGHPFLNMALPTSTEIEGQSMRP